MTRVECDACHREHVEASLPPADHPLARRAAFERRMTTLLSDLDLIGDPLVWSARPLLHRAATGRRRLSPMRRARQVVAQARTLRAREQAVSAALAADTLWVWTSVNQHRVMAPVMNAVGDVAPVPITAAPGTRLLADARRATRIGRRVGAAMASAGMDVEEHQLRGRLLDAARAAWIASHLIEHTRPRLVVVGTQHQEQVRGVVAAARDAAVPSFYLPHAPAARSLEYLDLPVNAAGLRGPAEVDYYAALGADPRRLSVVGDPGLEPPQPPALGGLPPVLALSPDPPGQLAAIVEVVAEAVGQAPLLVAPHPASDREQVRSLVRPGWSLASPDVRTASLLRQGPACVIQHSSGVALEAMVLGIPVIELQFPGERPNYPAIEPELVWFASDATGVSEGLRWATRLGEAADDRERLLEHAAGWLRATGADACQRATAALGEVPDTGIVLDGWALDGPASLGTER